MNSPNAPGAAPNNPPNRLRIPEGVSATGPVADITEAYVRAVIALPEILQDIGDSLALIAMYVEKKGLAEGILKNDDVDGGDDNEGNKA